jgi:exosortase
LRQDIVPGKTGRESNASLSPLLVFGILVAVSLAIWWGPLTSSFSLALTDEQYTHILLILPVSLVLIFFDRKPDWKSPAPFAGSSVKLGSVLLVIAALMTFLVRSRASTLTPDVQLSLNMLSLVLWWIAAVILCFGTAAFQRALFPLCFLFWMVPFPDFVLNPVVSLLQQGSAASARFLFIAAGVPVEQRGMLLHIPDLTVEVARECSSIRSSSMLLVTTMVLAQMLLRSSWRKILVIAVAIPISVAKNGLRIFAIAMLATRIDPGFLTGRFHRQGGIIFFLVALAAIFLLLWIERRAENHREKSRSQKSASGARTMDF